MGSTVILLVCSLLFNDSCARTSSNEVAKISRLVPGAAMLCTIIGVVLSTTCPLTQTEVVCKP